MTLVLSQRTYPGAGDIDDCWCVACINAAVRSRPTIWRPTITYFRAKAGDPDDGFLDGGSIQECVDGSQGSWPWLTIEKYASPTFDPLLTQIKAGRPASVALRSSALPSALRFNFLGAHQCAVWYDGTSLLFANPLAPDLSRALVITAAQLKSAMAALVNPASYRAVLYPKPVPGVAWGADVRPDIQSAYAPATVATKLRALGITTYGKQVNLIDLEAGLKKRGINYGTSVQLIDVRALMAPGTS